MANRRFFRKTYQKRKKFFLALKVICFVLFVFLLGAIFLFASYSKDLPRPEKFTERSLFESTKIFDRTGEILLYEVYGEEKRTWVSLEKVPEFLKQAVVVAEDANFYHHFGIEPKAIVSV